MVSIKSVQLSILHKNHCKKTLTREKLFWGESYHSCNSINLSFTKCQGVVSQTVNEIAMIPQDCQRYFTIIPFLTSAV